MKKLFASLMVLLMLAALCGCGANQDSGSQPDSQVGSEVDPQPDPQPDPEAGSEAGTVLSDFYQAIMEAQPEEAEALILFEEFNPDLIASFYPGLDGIELNQQAFYMPPIVTHPCEIVLVEVKNSEDVQKVVEIFRARIEQGAANTSYPESAAGWQQYAQVQQSGNFVCMIVLPAGYVIPENVFAA